MTRAFPVFVAVMAMAQHLHAEPSRVDVCVNAGSDLGVYRPVFVGIGYTAASDELFAPHNEATLALMAEMNSRAGGWLGWIRINGALTGKVDRRTGESRYKIYSEGPGGSIHHDWTGIDKTIDVALKYGFKLVLGLTYMPKPLAAYPRYRNLWHGAVIGPPKDYARWATMIEAAVRHLVARYGKDRVAQWRFEVWNEPDLCVVPYSRATRLEDMRKGYFWIPQLRPDGHGFFRPDNRTQGWFKSDWEAYAKLYDYTTSAVRAALPEARVGGPGIAGDIDFYISALMPHVLFGKRRDGSPMPNFATGEPGSPMDFYSWHAYGAVGQARDRRGVAKKTRNVLHLLHRRAGSRADHLELLVSESGPSTTPQSWMNSRYPAAWIVKCVDAILALPEAQSTRHPPKLFYWSKPTPIGTWSKHFGLTVALNRAAPGRSVVKRASFNAMEMLGHMTGCRLEISGTAYGDEVHAFATRDNEKSLAVIVYRLREGEYVPPTGPPTEVKITIRRLPFRSFHVRAYMIDSDHSNAYAYWKTKMRAKPNLTLADIGVLQDNDDLEAISDR